MFEVKKNPRKFNVGTKAVLRDIRVAQIQNGIKRGMPSGLVQSQLSFQLVKRKCLRNFLLLNSNKRKA